MILIINVCYDRLSESEFVKPIENILKNSDAQFLTNHYTSVAQDDLNKAEKIIICGTALRDLNYLKDIEMFSWLKEFRRPVLGICGGLQIIAKISHNDLIEKTRIGRFRVNVTRKNRLTPRKEFYSYFLNSRAVKIRKPLETLAKSRGLECMVKHKDKEVYGCLFHPEVLNPEVIVNFCSFSQ
jgi:GMP synthase-like glutamine amidotransferase